MHTAAINRVSVDAAGRFLVTASGDKTVRIWDVTTGELLRVLRPPLGAGDEGKLFSVAISPDSNIIAVGGWTGYEWDKAFSIYLFERASGRLVRRFDGLPNVVNYLVFSRDGKYLAATLGGRNGVRVYKTDNWEEIGADKDYASLSYGADFDRSGRLVTSCFDGFIRLYAVNQSSLQLIAKKTTSGGKEPYTVNFSPDASKIAVGFGDSTNVNVLSATDLSLIFAPDTNNVKSNLGNVTWSSDGKTLYAGGQYQIRGGNRPLRFWSDGGRGRFEETNASLQTVLDVKSLPNGGVIYGAGDPSWGIIEASGKRTRFIAPEIADYNGLLENFRVSNDGAKIGFAYEDFNKSAAQFSLFERRLELTADKNLTSPRTTANTFTITDWEDNFEAKLNGNKLSLEKYETSRSLAIAPDNKRFLLGTEYRIVLFDWTGKELWNVSAPSVAWSINISGDGRLALAAYADGTIRWYRMTDGKELLAFFPHNDKKRWVLWTPSGYYDASPDAEELIGWHVNNGKDAAADFFPVSRFRDVYYRPDIIDRVLKDLDETVAVNKANEVANRRPQEIDIAKRLPPVVTILSPQEGSEVSVNKVKIRYEVRSPSGEAVTGYKVLIDGRPATIERGVGVKVIGANVSELTVTIPEKDCEISLIAENKYAASVASSVGLKWKGKVSATSKKPRLLVLAVGVSKYQMANLNLGYAAKDANDFVNAMSRQKPAMYGEVLVKLLTDEQATRNAVVDGLDWVNANTNAEDVAMVFFAGHGDNDNLNRYYFLPHNFNPQSASTKVTFNDIKSVVETIKGKALFFIDTCRSGNVLGKSLGRNLTGFANELSSAENGVIVFTASTGTQVSLEDADWGNGAFTKALVEGINGKADLFQKGNVTITGLDAYISNRVKELTNQQQTPATAKPDLVSDFSIAAKF